jgi:predicted permease
VSREWDGDLLSAARFGPLPLVGGLHPVRHAVRLLGKAPGFTALCVATLGLGIGANTALFSVADAVLWRPLPFEDPGALDMVSVRAPAFAEGAFDFSAADVLDLQQHSRAFSAVAAFQSLKSDISGAGQPFRVSAARVTSSLFPLLGRSPVAGRAFTTEEDRHAHKVVMLGWPLARRLFGSPENAIGRTVSLNRVAYRIVGVMGPSFQFPLRGMSDATTGSDLWIPMSFDQQELGDRGDNFNFAVVARRPPGVSPEQALEDTGRVLAISRLSYPAIYPKDARLLPEIQPLAQKVSGPVESSVLLLLAAVALLLLIACANVANLTLTRALARRGELGVRGALGASRGRLGRQLITENLVLGLVGGAAGVVVAYLAADLVVGLAGDSLPRAQEIEVNVRALLFSLGVSLASGLLFGLAPLLWIGRTDLVRLLRESGRTTGSSGTPGRLRSALVVAQVALAVVLLTGAGLLSRTLLRLQAVDPGFRAEQALAVTLSLPPARYASFDQVRAFHERLAADLNALPGVQKLGIATNVPFGDGWLKLMSVEGVSRPGQRPFLTRHSLVAGDYFPALGIPLLSGRLLGPQDRPDSQRAILVNRAFARAAFGDGEAVGRRIKNGPIEAERPWLTIVGVVGDAKTSRPDEIIAPQTFEFWQQSPEATAGAFAAATYVLRVSPEPATLVPAIRLAVARLDPEQAIGRIVEVPLLVSETLARERFRVWLLLGFAATALLLSAIGVAGVVGIGVTQRRHEIGVRLALGAAKGAIVRTVVVGGFRLVGLGLAIGLVAGLALSRLVAGFLYGVPATDPASYGAAALLLAAAGLLAAYLPARRAAAVDPMVALRQE